MASFLGGTFISLPSDMRVILQVRLILSHHQGIILIIAVPFTSVFCIAQADPIVQKNVASKLCCTLGPSSRDLDTMCQLLRAGMKVGIDGSRQPIRRFIPFYT